ncbi:hypothetical protein WJX75_008873 [Coccomyxa subellipsoidea]|uniref:Uncharacterized protein n=1 Tax=Coccomyxa subellipsoidea TaxID=248742 RepID=A0ABR2YFH5_9CHLO
MCIALGDVMDPPHSIIVCANGTWCGKVAGTVTNVQILANSFAGTVVQSGVAAHNAITNTTVCFFDGVGLTGTFSEYLVDGALALDIENREVYAIYRSTDPSYSPDFFHQFKAAKSHVTEVPPIRFMGLLDTVGALGVPQVNPGGTNFETEEVWFPGWYLPILQYPAPYATVRNGKD